MESIVKVSESNLLFSVPLLAVLAVGGAAYLEIGVNRPRLAALHERHAKTLAEQHALTTEVGAQLEASRRRLRDLERKLVEERSAPPPAPLDRADPPTNTPRWQPRPQARPARPCKGDPNDPLNPCL